METIVRNNSSVSGPTPDVSSRVYPDCCDGILELRKEELASFTVMAKTCGPKFSSNVLRHGEVSDNPCTL